MKYTITEALPEAWVLEADPRHRHRLTAALVLELEKSSSREAAQDLAYEATRILGKRFAPLGALHVVERALALFRPDGVLADREEPVLGQHLTIGAWCRVLRRVGQCVFARPWEPWDKKIIFATASRLSEDLGELKGEDGVRKLVEELEAAFLVTLPREPPPDRETAVGIARKPLT